MDTQQLLEAARTIETIRELIEPRSSEWIPVVAAIGGALVGGMVSLIPTWYIESRREKKLSKSVYTAIVSEVEALLGIIEARDFVGDIKSIIVNLRDNPDLVQTFSVIVPEHYSRIYQANADKIGTLNYHDVAKIVQFHQFLDAIIQDVKPGGLLNTEYQGVEKYEKLLVIMEKVIELGNEIVSVNSRMLQQ